MVRSRIRMESVHYSRHFISKTWEVKEGLYFRIRVHIICIIDSISWVSSSVALV